MQQTVKTVFRVLGFIWPAMGGRLAYYLFFKPFRVYPKPKELALKAKGEEKTIVVNGKKVYYTVWGKGKVIICAHGWSSKGLQYYKFIESLVTNRYQVVIPDFPGHVGSEGKSSNVLEFKQTVQVLMELYPPYGLMGHSLGGMAAVLSLLDQPNPVDKLVLFNTAMTSDTIMTRFMEQIGGNYNIQQALLSRLKMVFNQDFGYYSLGERMQELEPKPDVLMIADDSDKDAPMNDVKMASKRYGAQFIATHNLGHNRGLKDNMVIAEVLDFLAKKKLA